MVWKVCQQLQVGHKPLWTKIKFRSALSEQKNEIQSCQDILNDF